MQKRSCIAFALPDGQRDMREKCQIKENSEATKRTQNNKKGSMQEDFVL
jgi:hypothetical protein